MFKQADCRMILIRWLVMSRIQPNGRRSWISHGGTWGHTEDGAAKLERTAAAPGGSEGKSTPSYLFIPVFIYLRFV